MTGAGDFPFYELYGIGRDGSGIAAFYSHGFVDIFGFIEKIAASILSL